MDGPTFGTRARRRARLKRAAVTGWIATLVLATQGVPTGMGLLSQRFERPSGGTVEGSEAAAGLIRFRRETFAARPAPKPRRPRRARSAEPAPQTAPAPAEPQSLEQILYAAAAEFGVDGGYLVALATCESGLDPGAVNPVGYHGLFQFDTGTWATYGYGSIYDAEAQARTAARLLAAGHDERWPNCP
jgi:soluble lytic murein transglycosylase-like protein